MKKTLVLSIAWLLMILGAACLCARGMATSASYLRGLMTRHAQASMNAEAYSALSGTLAGYLSGALDSPQVNDAYHDYELAHLADVRHLIVLSLPVGLCCLIIAAAIAIILRKSLKKKALPALGFASGLLLLVCGVAVLDFYTFFALFHRLAFTNDLWLLDPRTDLLIQLMPESFFRECAVGLLLFCCAVCAIPAAVILLFRKRKT